ncbi:calcium-transporting ATPase 2, plasma membrane-type [Capsicum annuum]|uniref:calcium-transporting ATPase 2, plasma membrane-type n=1 Tax=Capsicum annuum TaxID=4072 RepID=UPI001FB0B5F7|nr:calcium-transporting ATPase 2, plasma membrane-type [Capsicum annuum]
MESYLNENFGGVKAKHSEEEMLRRWRSLCGVVKNPKRRFRFTANLSKRYEAAAMRRTNHEKLRVAVLVSKAAFQFISAEKESVSNFVGAGKGASNPLLLVTASTIVYLSATHSYVPARIE